MDEALSICGDIECEWLLPEAYRVMAEVRLALGEVAEALECGQASLEIAHKTGDRVFEGVAHRVLGKVKALGHQQWEEGEKHFSESIDILKALENEHELGKSYYECGLVLRDKGEIDQAREYLSQAIEIFERTGASERLERANSIRLLNTSLASRWIPVWSIFPPSSCSPSITLSKVVTAYGSKPPLKRCCVF